MDKNSKKNTPNIRFDGFDKEWERKKVGDFAELKNGYSFDSKTYDAEGEFNVLTIANVQGSRNIVIDEKTNRIKQVPRDIQPHQILKDGDILVSMTGNVGRVSLNSGDKNLLNQRVGLLQMYNGGADFLYTSISTPRFENKMIESGQGAAQKNISKSDIENFEIMNTSLEEQKKIAEFFKQLDKLIELNEKKVEKLELLKKALLGKMFPVGGATTPKIRFNGFSDEWFAQILENCAEYNTKIGTDCACKFVSTDNMMKNCTGIVFSENNDTKSGIVYKPNDILISNIRPYLKKSYLMEQQGICSTDVLCVRPNGDTNPNFLYLLLSSDLFFSYVMESTKGTKMPRGDKQHIMRFPFMISTSKEEQKRLACCIKNIDTTSKMLKCKIEKFRNLKISFLNKMIPHTQQ